MDMLKLKLKVNAKSLAAEAKIIRKEENKILASRKGLWQEKHSELRHHRISGLRDEARACHLLRTFLNGKPRSSIEKNTPPKEIGSRCFAKLTRFSYNKKLHENLREWLEE